MDERELIHEMLDFVAKDVDVLGSAREVAHVENILRDGSGADRQLETWARTRDMRAVVDQITADTYAGLTVAEPRAASAA